MEGSDKRRIAFLGLGNMGLGMACKLAESGYDMAVWNRTRSKGEEAESSAPGWRTRRPRPPGRPRC